MAPEQYGTLAAVAESTRPDVEYQAVFAFLYAGSVTIRSEPAPGIDQSTHRRRILRCARSVAECIAHPGPRLPGDWRHETVPARGRSAVGDSPEDADAGGRHSAHFAASGFDYW